MKGGQSILQKMEPFCVKCELTDLWSMTKTRQYGVWLRQDNTREFGTGKKADNAPSTATAGYHISRSRFQHCNNVQKNQTLVKNNECFVKNEILFANPWN